MRTSIKVVEQREKGLEEVVEQMEILDKEKITTIKRQQHVETAAQLHLERVVKLEHNL
jgi:hypothetical protein